MYIDSNGFSDLVKLSLPPLIFPHRTQLKAEMCMQFENPDILLNWLGEQTLHSDQILTPDEIYKLVDNVTTADVNAVSFKPLFACSEV